MPELKQESNKKLPFNMIDGVIYKSVARDVKVKSNVKNWLDYNSSE